MKNRNKLLTSIIIFIMIHAFTIGGHAQRIIGYMPSWAGDANTIQYSKLSHINYAFALPLSDGSIKAIDNPGKLQTIVSKAHAQGVKVLVAVGGWSDAGNLIDPTFEALAGNATSRNRFVTACMSLVNTYNLDGIDIDWEYPDAGQSATNFDLLMAALSAQLKPQGKLLTAAVIGSGAQGNGVPSSAFSKLDFLNVMAYDANNYDHSTYNYATQCLAYWSGRGMPKSKINLGVPFYGRPSWESYAQLVGRGADPYQDIFAGVGYNGITTIKSKTQYTKDNGYGGIMIWEMSQDLNNQNSLLSAIYSVMGTVTPPPPPAGQTPYGGSAWSIPGKIEAENYDNGGQNTAYNDNSSGNSGNAYRSENVDIESCTDAGGGYNVGYVATGEWLEYTVNVTNTAAYKLEVRVAAIAAGKTFHVELNGTNISGTLNVPNTGGWQNWQTVSVNTPTLSAGQKVLRVYFDSNELNLNYCTFSSIGTPPSNQLPTVSLTAPSNNATYTASATINIAANANDADGSISKVEFYNGNTLIGTDNSVPYNYTWSNVGAGNYTITARAYDNQNASRTSSAVSVTVNPVVTGGCNTAAWSSSTVYTGSMRASRNGNIYEAKWWTQGNDPLTNSGQWEVWKIIGPCNARIGVTNSNDIQENQNVFSITPNPSFGLVEMTIQTYDQETADVELYNFNGEKVFSESNVKNGEKINFQHLTQGIYFMKVSIADQQFTSRIIKQ